MNHEISLQFQSHNGAIAASDLILFGNSFWSFNPTMVRLLQCSISALEIDSFMFQSHNGAIAASKLAFAPSSPQFQSHNGAIAACHRKNLRNPKIVVSIPQWCDCCRLLLRLKKLKDESFNPTMVRLLQLIKVGGDRDVN